MANPIKQRLKESSDEKFIPRELSWLSFNARVLQEAADPSVPVIQRLRYLGIFSNNLDEFFRVRVAEVRRLTTLAKPNARARYQKLLAEIIDGVVEIRREFQIHYDNIVRELRRRKIYLVNEKQLDDGQARFVRAYFRETVLPQLEPIMLSSSREVRGLTDESIYLAVDIRSGDDYHYALVEVPTDRLNRFVRIPGKSGKGGKVFIVLDNIIRFCMPEVFRGVIRVDESHAYTIKFSKDAELEIDTGITESLIERLESSLKARRTAEAVRFVYDRKMPDRLLKFLMNRFRLSRYDDLRAGGRYHNSKDFIDFPKVGPKYLDLKPLPPIRLPRLDAEGSIFDKIREKDILLYYPYHSFDYIIDLLKTAALDPAVTHIKICLYRVARDSKVCDALVNAVQNGKKVLAVVELQARFDEQANIDWAQQLAEAGVEVQFGIAGLKVHGKLILIERMEEGQVRYYSHVGTGNFNEKTALLYTDFSLITYHQGIGNDVYNVFDFLLYNYKRPSYKHLLVSPHTSRSGIQGLMEQEIRNARAGHPASMVLKCNNLVDRELMLKLYEASEAGVDVRLIIRGMCSLRPDVPGLSDNIKGISIVGRFLEHPRVYAFYNNGEPLYYIGSADLMTRNLDYRVEVLCPLLDVDHQHTVEDVLNIQWCDNIKARILDQYQTNVKVKRKKGVIINSQEAIHGYLETGKLPRLPKAKLEPPKKRRRTTNP